MAVKHIKKREKKRAKASHKELKKFRKKYKKERFWNKDVTKGVLITTGILTILLLIFMVWLNLFYYKGCGNDENCFLTFVERCDRAEYFGERDINFTYNVVGMSSKGCKINVETRGNYVGSLETFNGKEMQCILPYGKMIFPESNLEDCNGELRDTFEEEIAKRLFLYINQNLDELG